MSPLDSLSSRSREISVEDTKPASSRLGEINRVLKMLPPDFRKAYEGVLPRNISKGLGLKYDDPDIRLKVIGGALYGLLGAICNLSKAERLHVMTILHSYNAHYHKEGITKASFYTQLVVNAVQSLLSER